MAISGDRLVSSVGRPQPERPQLSPIEAISKAFLLTSTDAMEAVRRNVDAEGADILLKTGLVWRNLRNGLHFHIRDHFLRDRHINGLSGRAIG